MKKRILELSCILFWLGCSQPVYCINVAPDKYEMIRDSDIIIEAKIKKLDDQLEINVIETLKGTVENQFQIKRIIASIEEKPVSLEEDKNWILFFVKDFYSEPLSLFRRFHGIKSASEPFKKSIKSGMLYDQAATDLEALSNVLEILEGNENEKRLGLDILIDLPRERIMVFDQSEELAYTLIEFFNSDSFEFRRDAAWCVGRLKFRKAAPHLIKLVEQDDVIAVGHAANQALSFITGARDMRWPKNPTKQERKKIAELWRNKLLGKKISLNPSQINSQNNTNSDNKVPHSNQATNSTSPSDHSPAKEVSSENDDNKWVLMLGGLLLVILAFIGIRIFKKVQQ